MKKNMSAKNKGIYLDLKNDLAESKRSLKDEEKTLAIAVEKLKYFSGEGKKKFELKMRNLEAQKEAIRDSIKSLKKFRNKEYEETKINTMSYLYDLESNIEDDILNLKYDFEDDVKDYKDNLKHCPKEIASLKKEITEIEKKMQSLEEG